MTWLLHGCTHCGGSLFDDGPDLVCMDCGRRLAHPRVQEQAQAGHRERMALARAESQGDRRGARPSEVTSAA